jgi:hypothetical protein
MLRGSILDPFRDQRYDETCFFECVCAKGYPLKGDDEDDDEEDTDSGDAEDGVLNLVGGVSFDLRVMVMNLPDEENVVFLDELDPEMSFASVFDVLARELHIHVKRDQIELRVWEEESSDEEDDSSADESPPSSSSGILNLAGGADDIDEDSSDIVRWNVEPCGLVPFADANTTLRTQQYQLKALESQIGKMQDRILALGRGVQLSEQLPQTPVQRAFLRGVHPGKRLLICFDEHTTVEQIKQHICDQVGTSVADSFSSTLVSSYRTSAVSALTISATTATSIGCSAVWEEASVPAAEPMQLSAVAVAAWTEIRNCPPCTKRSCPSQ